MIKLSDYIAKRLKEVYNITHIFMISGGGAMHLNDSFGRYFEYTCCHNEQACAIAAEGYSRVGEQLSVVNVTTGPGGLNCLNGVFGQWTDSVPVLYISGQVKRATLLTEYSELNLRQLGDQEVDIVSVVKPLTKYAITIKNKNEIKYHLDKAIYEALNGRKGPVWLDIPIDLQAALIDESELIDFIAPKPIVYDLKIDEVTKKLKSAKNPLIIAGHGIRLSGQLNLFLKMIEKTNIPVVTSLNGFDLIPSNHKNFAGRIGTIGQRSGNFTLQNADLILCLGTRNNIRQISYNWENFAKNAYKIVVDIDKSELDKPTIKADLKINADLKAFLPALNESLQNTGSAEWLSFCKELLEKYSFENTKEYKSQNGVINVYDFVRKLSNRLNPEDTIVTANGSACVCYHQTGIVKEGQRVIWNSGNASMGYDLPSAIGASVFNKKGQVICVAGDGSIMMNLQELETIVHNNLPVKIFIINNDGYSSIRQTQKNFFNGHLTASGRNCGVSVPNFCRIGNAFGIKTVKLVNPGNIDQIIKFVMLMPFAVICEVMTEKEYSFTPKLSAKKLEDGTMISPSLEDMSPFLSNEEYNQNVLNEKDKRR